MTIEQIVRHLDDVPESIRTAIGKGGDGHYNHSLFWQMMKKGGGGQPTGALAKAIAGHFKGFDKFKYQNRRADYVAAFFNVINWDFVAGQYEKHKQ